jgi:hypothetical protein
VWEWWESGAKGGQSQVYNIRKPRAAAGAGGFPQKKHLCEGGESQQLVSATVDGAARRGSCRAVPSVSLVHTGSPNHQTPPVQSSLTSRRRTGALPHRARTHRVRWTFGRCSLQQIPPPSKPPQPRIWRTPFVVWLHRQHTHNRFRYKTKNTEYPSVEGGEGDLPRPNGAGADAISHADCCTALVWSCAKRPGNNNFRDRKD